MCGAPFDASELVCFPSLPVGPAGRRRRGATRAGKLGGSLCGPSDETPGGALECSVGGDADADARLARPPPPRFGGGEHFPSGPYQRTMDVQPIAYCGRIVAACTGERFLLADDLAYRPPGDPELVFVVMMCSYATDIARGVLPGPFDDVDARRYARAALIPEELLERRDLDVEHTAAALGVPAPGAASGARRARRVDPPATVALSASWRTGANCRGHPGAGCSADARRRASPTARVRLDRRR